MTKGYYANRLLPGTKIRIKGQRHVKAGELGEVVSADPLDPHRFRIRIGKEIFVIFGKCLEEIIDKNLTKG